MGDGEGGLAGACAGGPLIGTFDPGREQKISPLVRTSAREDRLVLEVAGIIAPAMRSSNDQPNDCVYVVGDDGLSRWPQVAADAWIGLLQTQRQLTRQLDAELEARHGLTLSGLELLGRLAAADEHCVRLSVLAEQVNLSLSRVSRIIDVLQARELVERRPCRLDARAINAQLTPAGLELARDAQRTHFAGVQQLFFDRLSPEEVATLAAVFNRFSPGAARDCSVADAASPSAPAALSTRD